MTDGGKQHIVFLTAEEIKALANTYQVAKKLAGEIPYVQSLEPAASSAYEKLLVKIKELNGD